MYTFYSNMFDSLEGNSFQVNQLEFLSNYQVVNLENKLKTMVLMSQLDNPILFLIHMIVDIPRSQCQQLP